MTPLPPIELTSNDTGRLIMYHVYKINDQYHMVKDAIVAKGLIERDLTFKYLTYDFEGLHKEMQRRGFVVFLPAPNDAPDLVCTFL